MQRREALDDWAAGVLTLAELAGGAPTSSGDVPPALTLQCALGQQYTGRVPREEQSPDQPSRQAGSPDDELLIPIDEVLANYDDRRRSITIYIRNIRSVAMRLKCRDSDLLYVVRLHEWAHALDHQGVAFDVATKRFHDSTTTSGDRSLSVATRRYRRSTESEKEFWAQAFAWVALQDLPNADELSGVFLELMKHQPPAYQLKWELLTLLSAERLSAARHVWHTWRKRPPEGATAHEALEALISVLGSRDLSDYPDLRSAISNLSTLISPSSYSLSDCDPSELQILIARSGPVQVRIQVEVRSPMLRFLGVYPIRTATPRHMQSRILNDLRVRCRQKIEKRIQVWAGQNQERLMEAWVDVNAGRHPPRLVLVA